MDSGVLKVIKFQITAEVLRKVIGKISPGKLEGMEAALQVFAKNISDLPKNI